MSAPDDDDEEFKQALKLSLELSQNEEKKVAEFPKALGASAFLERQKQRQSSSTQEPVYPSQKVPRTSESQVAPQSTHLYSSPDLAFSSLPEAAPRKQRILVSSVPIVNRAAPIVIDIDEEEEPKRKEEEKPAKMALNDDDLALVMSRMTEEQVEAYFSGAFEEEELKSLLQEAKSGPNSQNASPTKKSSSQGISAVPVPELDGFGSYPESQVESRAENPMISPYTSPQRCYRLNWVQGLPNPLHPRSASRDPVPDLLQLRDLICLDAQNVILTTFKLQISWLLTSVPALLKVPSIVYHGEDGDVYAVDSLVGPGSGADKLWNMLRQISAGRSGGKSKLPDKPPFRVERVQTNPGRMWPGCPHGKVIIVQYPNFLRVCVSTANLYESDYMRKTQAIWFQDFPLKTMVAKESHPASYMGEPTNHSDEATDKTVRALARDFAQSLKDYFAHLVRGFDTTFFDRYDYRNVRVSLITSIIGTVNMHQAANYGHMKIAELLSKEGCTPHGTPENTPSTIYAQMSSLGTLSTKYFDSVKTSFSQTKHPDHRKPAMALVWPSVDFVRRSIDGWDSGSSLCAGSKQITEKIFVVKSMLRYTPLQQGRKEIPPHIKTYWRIYADGGVGWMCLTSANFSKSAWGELQKGSKLNMSNFEAGVLFLPSILAIPATFGPDPELGNAKVVMLSAGESLDLSHTADGSIFHITLPIPFDIKAAYYPVDQSLASPADQPWTWDVSRPDLDRHRRPYATQIT